MTGSTVANHLVTPHLVEGYIPLSEVPIGSVVRIDKMEGGRQLTRRLLGLGLNKHSEIEVVHRRGLGVVVAKSGNRVALGGGIAQKVLVSILRKSN